MSGFFAALWIGWIGLAAAGLIYAGQKNVAVAMAAPIILAFLFEYVFYLVPGMEPVQKRLRLRYSKVKLAAGAAVTAVVPYLIYSVAAHQFRWVGLGIVTALALVASFWYVLLPRSAVVDIAFLCMAAAPLLARLFESIYTSPIPQRIDVLGHLMWIRTCAFALIAIGKVDPAGYGFLPANKDWAIGARHFLYFLPIGFPLAYALGLIHFAPGAISIWKVLGVFFGTLWVVALSEEFVFRGLLQTWFEKWTGNPHIALAAASILFGICHLPYRGFPNWKLALVATVAGAFYGRARMQSGSIQASMVAHALVVTVWRNVFT